MKAKTIFLSMLASLLLAACSGAGNPGAATSEVLPTVIAASSISAEGRLEPVRSAEIAFNTSGVVSEVLVEEGQAIKEGKPVLHLDDDLDSNYTAAQLELANSQNALNDLQNAAGTDLAQAVIDLKDAGEQYDDAADYLDYLENENKVPQTETRRFLIQTWRGYEYRIETKHFKGPAPEDWIIDSENDLALKQAELEAAQRTYDRPFDGIVANLNAKPEARSTPVQPP